MKELQPRISRIFRGGLIVTVVGILGNVALALFERFAAGWAVLEVTGHRTGRPLRNLRANPKVRLLTHGRWRDGVAVLLPDEDLESR